MSAIRPTGITANRQTNELIITWNDGHTSHYPFTFLRLACPCAECKGGHENMGGMPEPEVYDHPIEDSPRTHLVNLEAVGGYGLTPIWEDGHHFGIYNWNYLRMICPCEECRGRFTE